jgi:hypothetical protein
MVKQGAPHLNLNKYLSKNYQLLPGLSEPGHCSSLLACHTYVANRRNLGHLLHKVEGSPETKPFETRLVDKLKNAQIATKLH